MSIKDTEVVGVSIKDTEVAGVSIVKLFFSHVFIFSFSSTAIFDSNVYCVTMV